MSYSPEARPHEAVTTCEVCGQVGSFLTRAMTDRYGFAVSLNECRCGLVFLGPRLTAEAYAEFYQHHYRPLVAQLNKLDADRAQRIQHQAQAAYARQIGDWLASYLEGPIARLLDVGGSTGIIAEHMAQRFGLDDVWVNDPAPAELQLAAERGLSVLPGFIEDIPVLPEELDMVLVCQTIDHLLHPRAVFDRLRSLMRPGGYLFVDTLIWKPEYMADSKRVKIDHPFYWSTPVTRRFLADRGFPIIQEQFVGRHRNFLCQVP